MNNPLTYKQNNMILNKLNHLIWNTKKINTPL